MWCGDRGRCPTRSSSTWPNAVSAEAARERLMAKVEAMAERQADGLARIGLCPLCEGSVSRAEAEALMAKHRDESFMGGWRGSRGGRWRSGKCTPHGWSLRPRSRARAKFPPRRRGCRLAAVGLYRRAGRVRSSGCCARRSRPLKMPSVIYCAISSPDVMWSRSSSATMGVCLRASRRGTSRHSARGGRRSAARCGSSAGGC